MKKILFLVATFLLFCVTQNVFAQNPVKKVKYLKHVYEGEVNKKIPEGKGTMTFKGFTVQGYFQGNEVSDAILTVDNNDVTYRGNLSFNESQNVTLKPGGKIETIVYKVGGRDDDYVLGSSAMYQALEKRNMRCEYLNLLDCGLTGYSQIIETIKTEKEVDINNFDLKDINIEYTIDLATVNNGALKKLDPPTVPKILKAHKRDILYCEGDKKRGNDGRIIIPQFNFAENHNPAKMYYSGHLLVPATVLLAKYLPTNETWSPEELLGYSGIWKDDENIVIAYKDNIGRTWHYGGFGILIVEYPNGDYIYNISEYPEGNCIHRVNAWDFYYQVTRSDNIRVRFDDRNEYTYSFYNSKNQLIAVIQRKIQRKGNDAKEKILEDFIATKKNDNPLLKCDFGDGKTLITLHNCESLADSEIEDLLENEIFPKLYIEKDDKGNYKTDLTTNTWDPEEIKSYGAYIRIYGKEGNYFTEKKMYMSDKRIAEFEKQDREKHKIEVKKYNKKLLARIEQAKQQFKQRIGFDPSGKKLRDFIKTGYSFSALNQYFELTRKIYYAYNYDVLWKNEFPNESIMDYRLYNEDYGWAGYPIKILDTYYYFTINIDHGSTKCYYFGSKDGKAGYIWVRGDKVTSVHWY